MTSSPSGVPAPSMPTKPSKSPSSVYPVEQGLDASSYFLPPEGLDAQHRSSALSALEAYLTSKRKNMLGYQVNQDMNGYWKSLPKFMKSHLNNIGDPFQSGCYKPNTKVVERAVLDYYASLWRARWPHDPRDPESYWGYMLSMGSTEGNLYALWNARDYLSGRALIADPRSEEDNLLYAQARAEEGNPNAYHPVVFYSEDTHYSFTKADRVLGIDTFHNVGETKYPGQCPLRGAVKGQWPTEVPSKPGPSGHSTDGTGEIDPNALATLVEFFAKKGHPILISLNLGSTFKGAHDDVLGVCTKLLPIFHRHGLLDRQIRYTDRDAVRRRGFWIHVDGALGAGYAPFMRMAAADPKYGYQPDVNIPEFDFGLRVSLAEHADIDMVASIAMSGHKWPGTPWPCGIYMTKVKYQVRPPADPQYIGSPDTTLAGSRNGFSPLLLWDHLSRNTYQSQIDSIKDAQELAQYLKEQLDELNTLARPLWVARSPGALTVRFRRPADAIVAKWSLSPQSLYMTPGDSTTRRDYAHAFVMAGTTKEQIDSLISDLKKNGYPAQPTSAMAVTAPKPVPELLDGSVRLAAVPWSGRGFN